MDRHANRANIGVSIQVHLFGVFRNSAPVRQVCGCSKSALAVRQPSSILPPLRMNPVFSIWLARNDMLTCKNKKGGLRAAFFMALPSVI
ncbi:MAG: hypothetical protein Q9P14_05315 [candidate division KSB1 bacterium]|nr:hypothetical protein [candidate division KSB1 bacterium]MDQ7065274.1 hypothetical protein [candidate division KSB1 bacterium]